MFVCVGSKNMRKQTHWDLQENKKILSDDENRWLDDTVISPYPSSVAYLTSEMITMHNIKYSSKGVSSEMYFLSDYGKVRLDSKPVKERMNQVSAHSPSNLTTSTAQSIWTSLTLSTPRNWSLLTISLHHKNTAYIHLGTPYY